MERSLKQYEDDRREAAYMAARLILAGGTTAPRVGGVGECSFHILDDPCDIEDLCQKMEEMGEIKKSWSFFKRDAAIPEIGFEQDVSATAFELNAQSPLPENAIKGAEGVYVIRFKDRRAPEADGFQAEKADIEAMLLQQKKSKVFSEWLGQIRNRSEISYEENYRE